MGSAGRIAAGAVAEVARRTVLGEAHHRGLGEHRKGTGVHHKETLGEERHIVTADDRRMVAGRLEAGSSLLVVVAAAAVEGNLGADIAEGVARRIDRVREEVRRTAIAMAEDLRRAPPEAGHQVAGSSLPAAAEDNLGEDIAEGAGVRRSLVGRSQDTDYMT